MNNDGNRLAVGLPDAPNPDAYCECNPGAVLILVRNAQSFVETSSVQSLRPIWTEEDRLFDSQSSQSNEFGSSVALDKSGSRVLVGSPGSSEVHEFAADGDIWYQVDIIRPPGGDPSTGDEESTVDFGRYLLMSANLETLAISANITAYNVGTSYIDTDNVVYVYRGGGVWTQEALLRASNNTDEDYCEQSICSDGFGLSLAVSGDGEIVAVGAPNEESNSTGVNGDQQDNSLSNAGAAYAFTRNSGEWNQEAYIKASKDTIKVGEALRISDDGQSLFMSSAHNDELFYY